MKIILFLFVLSPALLLANVVEVAGYRFVAPARLGSKANHPLPCARRNSNLTGPRLARPPSSSFSTFGPSGGGGVRANVDRWMKQFTGMQQQGPGRRNRRRGESYLRPGHRHLSLAVPPLARKRPKPDHSLLGAIVEGSTGIDFSSN